MCLKVHHPEKSLLLKSAKKAHFVRLAIGRRGEKIMCYLAQWDYGEYCTEPTARNDVRHLFSQYIENQDYFLVRDITGDMTLYRKWYGKALEE